MCQFCRQLICPPFCPNADGNDRAYGDALCRNCGAKLPKDGFHYLSHGKPYCRECIEGATPDDLVRFCETTWDEWLENMGILPAVSAPKVHIGGHYEA